MELTPGESVPFVDRGARRRSLISPAARRGIRQRMLLFRQNALDRIVAMTGISVAELHEYRRELRASELPDQLLERGAGVAFTSELPQGALLYLLVRAQRPSVVLETGVGPGYSTAWILAALDANGSGELHVAGSGSDRGPIRRRS